MSRRNKKQMSNVENTIWTSLVHKRWLRAVIAMASVVVFVTVYSLILPAAALTEEEARQTPGIELGTSEGESGTAEAAVVADGEYIEEIPTDDPNYTAPEEPAAEPATEENTEPQATEAENSDALTATDDAATVENSEEAAPETLMTEEVSETQTTEPAAEETQTADAPADTSNEESAAEEVQTTDAPADASNNEGSGEADPALTAENAEQPSAEEAAENAENAEEAETETEEAIAEETAEEATEEETAPETPAEVTYSAGTLVASVGAANVTVTYDESAQIADGASLVLGTVDRSVKTSRLYETVFSQFTSISIADADGNEIAPAEGSSVSVSVEYSGLPDGTRTDYAVIDGENKAVESFDVSLPATIGTVVTVEKTFAAGTISYEGDGYQITLKYGEDAKLPENCTLQVSAVEKEVEVDENVYEILLSKFMALSLVDADGNSIVPANDAVVNAEVTFNDVREDAIRTNYVIADAELKTVDTFDITLPGTIGTVFTAEKKIYEDGTLAFEGEDFKVVLAYNKDSGIPKGCKLDVTEIKGDTKSSDDLSYDEYRAKAEEELDKKDRAVKNARFFDIKILDKKGNEIEPTGDVKVSISQKKAEPQPETETKKEDVQKTVVHFTKDEETQATETKEIEKVTEETVEEIATGLQAVGEKIGISSKKADEEEKDNYTFETDSFSVYGIIETNEITIDYLSSTGETYEISVNIPESAGIPKGAELVVTELTSDTQTYEDEIADLVNGTVNAVRLFDIEIQKDGEKIQPSTPVEVTIKLKGEDFAKTTEVVHFAEEGAELLDNEKFEDSVIFETGSFSVFGVVTLETTYITAEGETYKITVTYGPEAEIPDDAELKVEEIAEGSEEYFEYYNKVLKQKGLVLDFNNYDVKSDLPIEGEKVSEKIPFLPDARFFDISIISGGVDVEPHAPVEVNISYQKPLNVGTDTEVSSVHFTDKDIEIKDAAVTEKNNATEVKHMQDSFSVTGTIVVSENGAQSENVELNNTATFSTISLKAVGDDNKGPQTTKTVTDNGNGTHTIRLDILGEIEQQEEITKANVIVILDLSGSMNEYAGYQRRIAAAKSAVNNIAQTLLTKNNKDGITGNNDDDVVEMALISFNATAVTNIASTTTLSTYTSAVNNLTVPSTSSPQAGTNWEDALQEAANVTFDNDGDPTYVIFVSDGEPTFRNTNGGYDRYVWYNRQWNDEWRAYDQLGVYGYGSESLPETITRCYTHAVDDAQAIVSSGRQFYTIGAFGTIANMRSLTTAAGAPEDHYYSASSADDLSRALNDIADAITKNLGFSNVSTSDGVTELSSISAKVVDGHATGFRYYKNGTTWADAPEATPTADGITWDLSSENPLADKTTYSIEFDIWPSQEAYDTVANLNNGLVAYADLPQTVRDQINDNGDGTYSLKTNTSLTTTYTKDGVTDTDEWDKGNSAMSLDVRTFKVRKLWDNQLDGRPTTNVELIVTKDGNNYLDGDHSIKLTAVAGQEMISDDIFISCGFITHETDGYDVKEHGHDYSIIETEEYAYYWDLTAPTYRPMVIDGTPHMLVKTDSPTGTDGQDYYVIDGGTYQVRDTETILEATNERRSWVNLSKTVTDNSVDGADPDAFFEYTITVNNANAAKGTASDTGSDYYVWFSVDSDPSAAFSPVAAADLEYSGAVTPEDGTNGYYYVASGAEFTISIKKDWNIRFINLPAGSDYNFNETGMPNGFELDSITPNVSAGSGATPATVNGTVADGDVDKANTDYSVVYANKWATAPYVYIQKTDNAYAKSLNGAEFHMNKMTTSWTNVADYTLNQSTEVTVGGETKTYDNLAPLGPVGINRYQLIETECPKGYIKASDGFEFEVEKQSGAISVKLSDGTTANLVKGTKTVDGKTYDVYIIQLPNTPGQALPNTGGPGTLIYTLSGLILLTGSVIGLSMRRRERRCN